LTQTNKNHLSTLVQNVAGQNTKHKNQQLNLEKSRNHNLYNISDPAQSDFTCNNSEQNYLRNWSMFESSPINFKSLFVIGSNLELKSLLNSGVKRNILVNSAIIETQSAS